MRHAVRKEQREHARAAGMCGREGGRGEVVEWFSSSQTWLPKRFNSRWIRTAGLLQWR
jgi:hypothetical protein